VDISAKLERVSERAEAHFEKHRSAWTAKQYAVLLAKDARSPSLRPYGMPDDRKERLMRAADYMVRGRFQKRMNDISRAADRMQRGVSKNSEKDVGR
jgi:MoxR-like ATPase